MTSSATEYTLHYTQHLSSPLSWDFIISIFIVWLILIWFIYWLPSLLEEHFKWIKWYFLIKEILFIILFSSIYIYVFSNKWDWLTNNTYEEFYYWVWVLWLAVIISFFIKRKYLSNSFKWLLKSYLILSILVIWFNIALDSIQFYFDLF